MPLERINRMDVDRWLLRLPVRFFLQFEGDGDVRKASLFVWVMG